MLPSSPPTLIFELTAVTERSKELSREKYPDACIVRSFEELIGLEGLDLVVINTPDSTHYEYARPRPRSR